MEKNEKIDILKIVRANFVKEMKLLSGKNDNKTSQNNKIDIEI